MRQKLFMFSLLFSISVFPQVDTSLVLSEIMFYPNGNNTEFVELYNTSPTDSIELSNYKIKYYNTTPDVIISAGYGTKLAPKSFAVILENDYDFVSGIYNSLIPNNALILKISDNSFGSTGMANTTSRAVALLRPNNDTLEIKTYSANNSQGYSDEKKIMSKDTLDTNWGNSTIANGTPGAKNSISPLQFDVEAYAFSVSPTPIQIGSNFTLRFWAKNKGTNQAQSFSTALFYDINNDNIPQPSELLHRKNISSLTVGDSVQTDFIFTPANLGTYKFIALVEYSLDENTNNNQASAIGQVLSPAVAFNAVVVNEIMYAPTTGEPEWVEIYNKSASPINLKNWRIKDNTTTQATISTTDLIIQPDSFLVISNSASITNFYLVASRFVVVSFPALNNTDDAVVIKDSSGFIIDSMYYFSSWGGSTGRSLERVYYDSSSLVQSNWKTSTGTIKGTPGRKNSVTPKNNDLSVFSFSSSKPFVLSGESTELKITVKNLGLINSQTYIVSLYADMNKDSIANIGELLTTFSGNSLAPNESKIFSFEVSNFIPGKNIFIGKVSASLDEDSTNNIAFTSVNLVTINEIRNDIVINEIMYAPTTGEPEWVELFNRSLKTINLKKYRVADAVDTVTITTNDFFLLPSEYVVISKDSSVLQFYNISARVIKASIPTLNNDIDNVIILDSLNRTIDSLRYVSTWGGGSGGRSLERISAESLSTNPLNWKTSTGLAKATPGKINSVTQKDFDIRISNISTLPAFPVFGDNVAFSIIVKNISKNTVSFSLLIDEDTNLDSISDINVYSSSQSQLAPNDSLLFNPDFTIHNLQQLKHYIVKTKAIRDDDTTNNYFVFKMIPGYPKGSVIVNEIMYTPANGEPEWIEIKNISNETIGLKNWSISDVLSTPSKVVITEHVQIVPGERIVICRDSSIYNFHRVIPARWVKLNLPSLNNDADGIIIYDDRGAKIDSMLYNSTWGGTNGYSLERISSTASSVISTNWASSTDIEQSTPGRINSVTQKQFDLTFANVRFSPLYPKALDDVKVISRIKNAGFFKANIFYLTIHYKADSNNASTILLDSILIPGVLAFDSLEITSTGYIPQLNYKTIVTASLYYAEDEDPYNNVFVKSVEPGFAPKTLLISEIMYDPKNNEPEWVELFNVSKDSVNLKNWIISDVLTTPVKSFITSQDYILEAQQRIVIARDSSLRSFYPGENIPMLTATFGSLGNTTDGIIICDFRNAIIDSVVYKSAWGGKNGKSLERLSFTGFSTDSSSWATSLLRGTPGKINSVEIVPSYQRNQMLINEIMYEPDIDNTEFIEFYNGTTDSINIGGWRIEDEKKNAYRLSDSSFVIPPLTYFVLAADSIVMKKYSNLSSHNYKTILNVSSLGLINTGELILLKDIKGNVIDSVFYSDKWHNKQIPVQRNKSLERISPGISSNAPSNWSTSVSQSGATPGQINSIFVENKLRSSAINIEPNPFSPDNDGFEDFTIINYNLTQAIAQVRVKIFDNKGRLVRTLANNTASGNRGSIVFDGRDEGGSSLRIGIYIILLEAVNVNNSIIEVLKTALVVARKL